MFIFTESALKPIQSVSRDVCVWFCPSVCAIARDPEPSGLETSDKIACGQKLFLSEHSRIQFLFINIFFSLF